MLKKRLVYELPYFVLASIIIAFLFTHHPNLEYDVDPSYLQFGPIRPPLYPLFIWLFHWAGSYQFIFIMWIQGALLFASLLYTRFWLEKNLQLSGFPIFLICLFIILTIGLHFQIWFIQSEGLSFPFFIVTFFLLVECFHQFNLKKISYLAILVNILVLTRLQFYYFYIVFVMLWFWYLWQRIPIKYLMKAMVILFGSMLLTTVIDHSYHYYKHGFFAGSPYKGILIMFQTLYLANDNAADYFQDPTEKAYVQSLINQRNSQHLNQDVALLTTFKPSYYNYANQSLNRNFMAIQKIIVDTLNTSIENSSGKATNFKADKIAMSINKTLILHDLKKNILFLIWRFLDCMGGIPFFLFFLILFIGLSFKIVKEKIKQPSLSLSFVTIIIVITFLNAAIVAISNQNLPVYFCYSQFMLYCLGAFLVKRTVH